MSPGAAAVSDDALWGIGLAAWIIQDGNYPDFSVGDRAEFALEFWSEHGLTPVDDADDGSWILDVGVLAFQKSPPPPGVRAGQLLKGQITLGIDPCFYVEYLHEHPGYPPMVHTWDVRGIDLATASSVPTAVARTDARNDDDGHAGYILRCLRLPVEPTRTGATAT